MIKFRTFIMMIIGLIIVIATGWMFWVLITVASIILIRIVADLFYVGRDKEWW